MKQIEQDITSTIDRHVKELLDVNWASIAEMLKDTPDGKIGIGFKAAIDWSEAKPKVKTTITYARQWKDEREDELEDPNQSRMDFAEGNGQFPPGEEGVTAAGPAEAEPIDGMTPIDEAQKPKRRGRKAKAEAA